MSVVENEKAQAKDPVCGMSVDRRRRNTASSTTERPTIFAAPGCRTKFAADPARYLGRSPPPPPPRPARRDLHLPDGPGGAAGGARHLPDLRHGARTGDAVGGGRAERRARRHEAPALVRAGALDPARRPRHGRPLLAARTGLRRSSRNWIEFVLATPVALGAGWPFFVRAWASVRTPQPQHVHPDRARRRRRLDLQRGRDRRARDLSRAIAAITAGRRSISRRRRSSRAGDRGSGAGARAREKTGDAIRALLDLAPKRALRIDADGTTRRSPLDEVAVGDRLRVRPGRKNPGRRRGGRRRERGRRIHDDRQIDAGR